MNIESSFIFSYNTRIDGYANYPRFRESDIANIALHVALNPDRSEPIIVHFDAPLQKRVNGRSYTDRIEFWGTEFYVTCNTEGMEPVLYHWAQQIEDIAKLIGKAMTLVSIEPQKDY